MSFTTKTVTIADSPYTCAATDNLILVDLSGISGHSDGPEIHLVAPVGASFPITIRNINGDSSVHNWSVWPDASATGGLQNPFDLTDFSVVFPSGFGFDHPAIAGSVWQYDRASLAWRVASGSQVLSRHGFEVVVNSAGITVTKAPTLGGVQAPLTFPLSRQDAQELATLLLGLAT